MDISLDFSTAIATFFLFITPCALPMVIHWAARRIFLGLGLLKPHEVTPVRYLD